MINHQQYGRCTRFEMNMMECLEAYGLDKGRVKCAELIEDFNECHNMTKQYLRHMVCILDFGIQILSFVTISNKISVS